MGEKTEEIVDFFELEKNLVLTATIFIMNIESVVTSLKIERMSQPDVCGLHLLIVEACTWFAIYKFS